MAICGYHGSNADFDEFRFDKIGESNGLNAGYGMYFSTVREDAEQYGDILYTVLLDQLGDDVSNEDVTIIPTKMKAICNTLGVTYRDVNDYETDVEIIRDIIDTDFNGKPQEVLTVLIAFGYTHTRDMIEPLKNPQFNADHYIVFNLDKITIIDKHVPR